MQKINTDFWEINQRFNKTLNNSTILNDCVLKGNKYCKTG